MHWENMTDTRNTLDLSDLLQISQCKFSNLHYADNFLLDFRKDEICEMIKLCNEFQGYDRHKENNIIYKTMVPYFE